MTIKLSSVLDYALKAFLVVGAVFYLAVPSGTKIEDALAWGYGVQDLFFRYGVIVLFALSLMVSRVRELKFQSLPMFLLLALGTALLFGFDVNLRSGILNIGLALLLYKIVYESIDLSKLKTFAWWFGWLLLLNLVWCVLQWLGHDMVFVHADAATAGKLDTIVGFMKLKVHLGVLAALLTPLVVCYAPCFLLCIIPLVIFSQSSTAALAIVISGLLMGYYRMKNITLLLLSLILLAFGVWFIFFFDMPGGQFGARFKVWEFCIALSLKGSVLLGTGVGHWSQMNFSTIQGNGLPLIWKEVHNEFLQGFYEFGLVGMACVGAYVVEINKKAKELMKDKATLALYASFISIIILSCVHFPFHLSRFVPIIIFILASLHARVEDLKNG